MAPISVVVAYTPAVAIISVVALVAIILVMWLCADGSDHKPMTKVNNFTNLEGTRLANTIKTAVPVALTLPSGNQNKPTTVQKLNFNAAEILKESFKNDRILSRLTIEERRLTLTEIIGHGNFGLVYKGTLVDKNMSNPRPVAVKTVQGPNCKKQDVEAFIKESARMKGFTHQHVLCMTGVVTRDNTPYIVLPYMANGDLKAYIADRHRKMTLEDLTKFGYHVALGMQYLGSKNFVHRDLAARNCMVSEAGVVKVADFGLSRDLYEADYYKMSDLSTPLPIRWVALESILSSRFTAKSDVWSYGVLLWELFTRGLTPYPSLKNNLEVVKYLRCGERLQIPDYVTSSLAKVAIICWATDPKQRPDFSKICEMIHDILEDEGDYLRPKKHTR